MDEYISREAERNRLIELIIAYNSGFKAERFADYLLANGVAVTPAADAVKVVRCEHCLYWQKDVDEDIDSVGRCRWAKYIVSASDYCSRGIVKMDGKDEGE